MNFNELFSYKEGFLYWKSLAPSKSGRKSRIKIGDKTSELLTKSGYDRVVVNNKFYYKHRVIWEMHNGPIPDGMQIDHINHTRNDNRIENLRLVSNSSNSKNRRILKRNTSGFNGVYFSNTFKRWIAEAMFNGVNYNLGKYKNKEEAIKARRRANVKLGFHENHGK